MRKVVFLPIHPNMWEGFETIWEKEISDSDTDVKVIPISTYQVGYQKKIYDAEYITTGYPKNVEICGMDDYDLASERPDTIYIQNIQDLDNPIFTVHPDYHTPKLRLYTNNLVYIPYNCMGEISPDYNHIKQVYGKLLTPPGIKNVDKIILHSENIKTIYLILLAEYDDELRQQWDQKITCENYPRIEILKKYTKDTVLYPATWNRHLFDKNGERKETVLFVTSIFGVLEFNRSHFRAARKILEEYLEKKDRIALIWRPHKYLPEIIMKLRPELFDDFRALLEFYIGNDIGVFDETPTPTPAIILSDRYIGDECAVKELFKSTGKTIVPNELN